MSIILQNGIRIKPDFSKNHGSWIVSKPDGMEYLDLATTLSPGIIGYNHPVYSNTNIDNSEAHLVQIEKHNNILLEEFQDFFKQLTPFIKDYQIHFCLNGSLAIEKALKAALYWKSLIKRISGKGVSDTQIIQFREADHGNSELAYSLNDNAIFSNTYPFPVFDWPRIINPKIMFSPFEDTEKLAAEVEKEALDQIKQTIRKDYDKIAAIIIEPIQGAGGDNHFRAEFFNQLRKICDEENIILIFDEVQTGFGITGKMWAFQHFDVDPDFVVFGHKDLVSGIMFRDQFKEIDEQVFRNHKTNSSSASFNFQNLIQARNILKIFKNEKLTDHVKNMGVTFLEQIKNLEIEFPAYVTGSRGCGLFIAFDLPSRTERDDAVGQMIQNGLIVKPSGECSIGLRPRLNIFAEEIDIAIDKIIKSLRESLK